LDDVYSDRARPSHRFRGTLSGDGRPGPIEERIGRRLVRLVDPLSAEGVRLLSGGSVHLVGPEGDSLGRIRLDDAYRRLLDRVQRRLDEEIDAARRNDLEEGRDRLLARSKRLIERAPD